jgi:hypothetical protein
LPKHDKAPRDNFTNASQEHWATACARLHPPP